MILYRKAVMVDEAASVVVVAEHMAFPTNHQTSHQGEEYNHSDRRIESNVDMVL